VPGQVKSRLAPLLGETGAARLYARMVDKTLATARAAGFDPVELYCSPRVDGRFFATRRNRFGARLRSQGRGDLGERMYRAFKRVLRRHRYAVLIGSDCPALRPADLRAAARALHAGADAVLAPAEDGGYPLIGLRRVSRRLFDGIPWGGPEVLARTRRRMKALRWRWKELRTLWDVDRPEDVRRLRRSRLLGPRPRRPSGAARERARRAAGSPARSGAPGPI
jgi:rSAM/selenodomain-associated transferase 1